MNPSLSAATSSWEGALVQASAFAEEADQAASLAVIGATVVGVVSVSHLMRPWWNPVTDAFVAVPVFYALAVVSAGLAALLLTVRARITDNDRLRWIVAGLVIAGTAVVFQGLMVSRLSRVPELATPSATAALSWVWHGALATFVIGGALAPHRRRLRQGLLASFAAVLGVVLFEPAWEVLPLVVTADGTFTVLHRPVTAAAIALTLVAIVAWGAVRGRSATRPDVWVVVMLLLALWDLVKLYQAGSWNHAVWWSSPPLRAAPFAALAAGLLADAVRMFGLLHRHEHGLREQLARDVELALQGTDRPAWDPDAETRIRDAIVGEAFSSVFQPIISLATGEVLAVEALTRFSGEPARTPDRWFDEAHAVGLGVELELAAIRTAMVAASELPASVAVSVNASPVTLADPRLLSFLDGLTGHRRLIVEVTEHAAIEDYSHLDDVLAQLRQRGVRIAIDDAGAGFASLRHVVRLGPELIKLDMSLTRDVHRDPVRRALAASLADFARRTGTTLIAEGVENEAELAVLGELGVDAAQGYLLCRPTPVDELPEGVLDGTASAALLGRAGARSPRNATEVRPEAPSLLHRT